MPGFVCHLLSSHCISVCLVHQLAHMIEEHEELIEHWWFKEYAVREDADLLQFLCIDNIKGNTKNHTFHCFSFLTLVLN